MQRFVQLSVRSLVSPSTFSSLNGPVAIGHRLVRPTHNSLFLQQRCISISQISCKQKSSSSSSSSSNDQRDGKKKRSLMDMANETLENAGLKARSSDQTASAKRNRREGQGRTNVTGSNQRPGGQSPQRMGGNWGDSTTNVNDKKQRSTSGPSEKSKKFVSDHRAAGPVRHDKKSKQFLLDLGDNQVARIEYRQVGKNLIDLYHTEVPEKLRGEGAGRALAKGALELASQANLKLKVNCKYLQHYLDRYADKKYKKLLD